MSSAPERPRLVEEVLSGRRRELQHLAAEGLLPLPLNELVGLQAALASSDDAEIAALARRSLTQLDPQSAVQAIAEGVSQQALAYLALERPHPTVLEAVIRHRGIDHGLLRQLAPVVSGEMQEILLLRQDAIVESPEILDALEENPQLTAYAHRRVREYREHLLPRQPSAEPGRAAAELERAADELTEEEVQEAIETVAAEAPAEGKVDETTGLAEAQIRMLPVPVRLRLTRGASRSLRNILVRDNNPQVATSVIRSNPLSDLEVEEIAGNRSVRAEVLQAISNNRSWMRRYPVVLALARNPRSPAALAVRLVARLSLRDLGALSRDHNVTHTVRALAGRLYRMKRK
ncbi:MAG: hypothetical protein R3325_07075 [Thermoanaerobaculia bacterium]|nr:hypothetical protein [Thermoanaerobaculia bacterium]